MDNPKISHFQPMRICLLCEGYPPSGHGGIGMFTQSLARALVRAGHQAWVIGMNSERHPGSEYEEEEGVRVTRLLSSKLRLKSKRNGDKELGLERRAVRWRAGILYPNVSRTIFELASLAFPRPKPNENK